MKPRNVNPLDYVNKLFGPGGWFEENIPGYVSRPEQLALADHFAGHLFRSEMLQVAPTFVSEAPCGTGKTYAYLAPLLYAMYSSYGFPGVASKTGILVSTAGISLQEQIVLRDLPRLLEIMRPLLLHHPKVVLLKGVNNYVCMHKLKVDYHSMRGQVRPKLLPILREIQHAHRSQDLNELPPLEPVEAMLLTTTSEECKGAECPEKGICHAMQVKALAASTSPVVVVTNHHYFAFLDKYVTDDSATPLNRKYVVIDEAHELPAVLREVRTDKLTRARWKRYTEAGKALAEELGTDPSVPFPEELFRHSADDSGAHRVGDTERVRQLQKELRRTFGNTRVDTTTAVERFIEERANLLKVLHNLVPEFHPPGCSVEEEDKEIPLFLRWTPDGEELIRLPDHVHTLNPDAYFSATLRYAGSYERFTEQVCATTGGETYTAASPFDWSQAALAVFPKEHLVDPTMPREQYDQRLAAAAVDCVQRSQGRALFACTSWSSVRAVANALRQLGTYTVLEQGTANKAELVEQFKVDTHSVMVGTLSMWTGVDVPGEALSLLVIDKIPFRGGSDPWVMLTKEKDPQWFGKEVLAPAAMLLAQGFGRLIRSTKDRGVFVLLDPRVSPFSGKAAGYAKNIWETCLPPELPISDTVEDIDKFLGL